MNTVIVDTKKHIKEYTALSTLDDELKYLKAFPELEGKFSVHFCKTADGVSIL